MDFVPGPLQPDGIKSERALKDRAGELRTTRAHGAPTGCGGRAWISRVGSSVW